MVREFFIQERIPKGIKIENALEELGWEIMQKLGGMEIDSLDLDTEEGWVKVRVEGADEGIAENLLCRIYGRLKRIEEAKPGEVVKGFVTDLGKFGYGIYFKAFLDEKDCLYPLYEMRRQLVGGRKLPARTIARLYGFVDDLAMELSLTRLDEKGIYVAISPRQVQVIRNFVRRKREILVIVRATPKQINRALTKTGHLRDVSIVRTSFLSSILICKPGTQAKGLIPRLGPHLPGAVFSVVNPDKFREVLGDNFLYPKSTQ